MHNYTNVTQEMVNSLVVILGSRLSIQYFMKTVSYFSLPFLISMTASSFLSSLPVSLSLFLTPSLYYIY